MKKSKHIEEKYLNKIIRVAYGEGNIIEKISVYFRSGTDPGVKKLFEEYRETAASLEEMKSDKCPDELVKNAEKNISVESRFRLRIPDILFTKQIIAAAASVVLILLFSVYIFEFRKPAPEYSTVQVKQAEVQVKETLAIIDRVFQNTRRTIEDDVLRKQVTPPIKEGIYVVNNLFKGG